MAALGVRAFDFDHPLPYICQCRASCLLFCRVLIIPPEPTASFCAAHSESVSQGEQKKNALRTDQISTIGPVVCVCTSAEEKIIPAVPWQKPNRSNPCCFGRIPAWIPAFSGLPGHGSRENYSSSALCPGTGPAGPAPTVTLTAGCYTPGLDVLFCFVLFGLQLPVCLWWLRVPLRILSDA